LYHDTGNMYFHFVTREGAEHLLDYDIGALIDLSYQRDAKGLEKIGKGGFGRVYVSPIRDDVVVKMTEAAKFRGKEAAHILGDDGGDIWHMDLMTTMKLMLALKSCGLNAPNFYGFSLKDQANYSKEMQEWQWMQRINAPDLGSVMETIEEGGKVHHLPNNHSLMAAMTFVESEDRLMAVLWESYEEHKGRAEAAVEGIFDLEPRNMLVDHYDADSGRFGFVIIDPIFRVRRGTGEKPRIPYPKALNIRQTF